MWKAIESFEPENHFLRMHRAFQNFRKSVSDSGHGNNDFGKGDCSAAVWIMKIDFFCFEKVIIIIITIAARVPNSIFSFTTLGPDQVS